MKYVHQVTNIRNYDVDLLWDEIKAGQLNVQKIHIGNGVLILEFKDEIDDAGKTILSNILAGHSPVWFEWGSYRKTVKCAEDVDKITSMRIRQIIGDLDPVQGQLKMLTELVYKLYKNINTTTSLAGLKAQAQSDTSRYSQLLAKRITIIQEGKDFKTSKGW